MRNNNNLTISILLLALILTCASASTECQNLSSWTKAKALLQEITSGNASAQSGLQTLIYTFENSTPKVATADDLGKCSAYIGQQSCCTAEITNYLDRVVLFKAKPLLSKDNIVSKLMKVMVLKMSNPSCSPAIGKTKPSSIIDFLLNSSTISSLNSLVAKNKECKIKLGKAIVAQTRAAVCFACAGTDKVSDYYNPSGKIILNQSSVTSYQDAVNEGLQCFADILTQQSLTTLVESTLSNYIAAASDCNASIQNAILSKFVNKVTKNVCKGLSFFTADSSCENASDGDSDINTLLSGSRMLSEEMLFRHLAEDAVTSVSGGVNSYVPSSTDSSITEDGSVTINTEFSLGELGYFSLVTFFILLLIQ